MTFPGAWYANRKWKTRKRGCICVYSTLLSAQRYLLCLGLWKVVWVDFLSSADQCTLLWVFNQCARLNVASKPVSTYGEMVIGGSLGFRFMSQLMGWWAPECNGPSSHVVTVDTVGVAAAPPADYCFHWSVDARPSAPLVILFGWSINQKAHRRTD